MESGKDMGDPERCSSTGVAAIIINYNGGEDLDRCVASLVGQDNLTEILVIDNGSTDGSLQGLDTAGVRVVRSSQNLGFAGGANLGARSCDADVMLFLNPDVILDGGCIAALSARLRERQGVAAPVIRQMRLGTEEFGGTVDVLGQPVGINDPTDPPLYVHGCVLATTRDVFESLGGFDERYFMIVEDVDLCWRALLAGMDVSICDDVRAWHRGGATTPGAYLRDGRLEISEFRVALRERNTLTTLIKCAPTRRLIWLLPVALLARTAAAAVCMGLRRPRLAVAIGGGVVWNVKQLPETLRRRRRARPPGCSDRVVAGRLAGGSVALRQLRTYGMPAVASSDVRARKRNRGE